MALFDESSFAKMEIAGPGAADLLERLCDNRVAREPGKITYTQMLNTRGGIECDFTVARLSEELFQIVTGTAFGNHDREWIRKHLPGDGTVQVRDVTSAWSCFGIWGPRAREVLAPLTPADLSNDAFPYMAVREITVGSVPVRALRVTYVGELGWELYCPTEYGLGLWRALWEAGEPHGIVAAGYRAIDSLRLEKGYRVWGADITPDETPYEGGVGFCVKLDKEGGFIGREALAEAKEAGPRTRLCCLVLADPRSVALGNEPVRIDGEIVGRVTTGGYGYTVERSIAYAYLPPEHAEPGTAVEVEIFGEWVAGEVATEPLFDPEGRADPRLTQLSAALPVYLPEHGRDPAPLQPRALSDRGRGAAGGVGDRARGRGEGLRRRRRRRRRRRGRPLSGACRGDRERLSAVRDHRLAQVLGTAQALHRQGLVGPGVRLQPRRDHLPAGRRGRRRGARPDHRLRRQLQGAAAGPQGAPLRDRRRERRARQGQLRDRGLALVQGPVAVPAQISPARMCSVPRMWVRTVSAAAAGSPARRLATSSACWALERVRTSSG